MNYELLNNIVDYIEENLIILKNKNSFYLFF